MLLLQDEKYHLVFKKKKPSIFLLGPLLQMLLCPHSNIPTCQNMKSLFL